MNIGDFVEIVSVPAVLPQAMGIRELFSACVGRVFPIAGVANGLLELRVGEVVGEKSFMPSILIEPGCVVVR